MHQLIMPGLYRIQVPLPHNPMRVLNSYVIKGEDRDLVIDTGFRMPECMEALTQGLRELNVDMNNADILLTHLHADHTGLAPELASENSKVFISRAEVPWMGGDSRRECWKGDNVKFRRSGFPAEALTDLDDAVTRDLASDVNFVRFTPIDDGDEFKYGEYTLRAIATPGHTPMHMCFWMEDQKTMFTGDHVLFDITPNIVFWYEMEDSLGEYLDSLRKIDQYDVQLALPGHRETGDFHGRIKKLLNHHEDRINECLNVIRENPGLSVYDITGKMTWKIRCSSWEDFPRGQKWFAVGECHSHIRHLEKLGLVETDYSEDILHFHAI